MYFFLEKNPLLRAVNRFLFLLAFFLVAGTPAGAAAYTLTYEGLRYAEDVYLVDASAESSPYVNTDNYIVHASGDTSKLYRTPFYYLYGIYSVSGPDIVNQGDLTLNAAGGISKEASAYTNANVYAYNIYSSAGGAIDNSGSLGFFISAGTSTTSGALGYAFAGGYGIYVDSGGSITNSGSITGFATGGTANGASVLATANATAQGIHSNSSGAIDNSGNIIVTATGGAASGTAKATAQAYGIYAQSSSDSDLTNSGDIIATATGGTADSSQTAIAKAFAYGIYAKSSSAGNLTNSGNITVTAIGDSATGSTTAKAASQAIGIYSDSSTGTIANRGDIIATATGGTADSSQTVIAKAFAYGIYAKSSSAGNLTNSGNITVTATGGTANGVNGESYAAGILIYGDTELTNTGVLQAFAETKAYEVDVESGLTTLKETYNLTLDGDAGTGSIYIASGAGFNINNANLTLSTGSDFAWDTEYLIFENCGTVTGSFANVSALNPNVTVGYFDQGTGSSADDGVSLSYTPKVTPFNQSLGQVLRFIHQSGALMDQRMADSFLSPGRTANAGPTLYADAGTTATDASFVRSFSSDSRFFLTPYYTHTSKDASPTGYEARGGGLMTGWERMAAPGLYGFHLGFGRTRIDYTGTGMAGSNGSQYTWTAGLHAMGDKENWIWRARFTGFAGENDYNGLTGLNLDLNESADSHTFGINSALSGGYQFRLGRHTLLPQAGLDYIGAHRQGFTTQAEDSDWEVSYDSQDIHQLTATAALRWQTDIRKGDLSLIPSLTAGLRYLLTDDELGGSQSVSGGTPVTTTTDQDRLAGTLAASLRLRGRGTLSSEFAYAGEFGDETVSHSFWLRINCKL